MNYVATRHCNHMLNMFECVCLWCALLFGSGDTQLTALQHAVYDVEMPPVHDENTHID